MQEDRRILFKSFSSGSCGNCYFLGIEYDGAISAGVIIDAGVSVRRLRPLLQADHLSTDDFSAVLVTHDHMDHIHSLGGYWKYLHKRIWCTSVLKPSLCSGRYTLDAVHADVRALAEEGWTEIIPDLVRVRWFEVPHDATQTVGYALDLDGYRVVVITDVGSMTEEAIEQASMAGTLVLEANYDDIMLEEGPYPRELKDRIRSGHGHLSNAFCAEAVKRVWHPGLRHIYLCHLSENNNTPALAFNAVAAALGEIGFKPSQEGSFVFENADETMTMMPLPRRTPSPLFTIA